MENMEFRLYIYLQKIKFIKFEQKNMAGIISFADCNSIKFQK